MIFNKNTLKLLFRILIIPFSFVAFIIYIHYSLTWEVFYKYLNSIKIKYLIYAIGCYTLCLFTDHICYAVLRHHFQKKFNFWWEPHACLRAQFWEMLTPGTFAVGPVIHTRCMNKQGVSVSDSATIILTRQIISNIVLVVTSITLVCSTFSFFSSRMTPILWILYATSMIISIITINVYLLVPRNSKLILNIVNIFFHFLYKIKIIRKESRLESLLIKSKIQIENLKSNMSKLDYSFKEMLTCGLLSLLNFILGCTVQYFIAKMLSINIEVNYIIAITSVSLITSITSIIPVPGGLGTTDLAYVKIFCPIFGNSMSEVMMLFSRLITYYFPLVLGAVMFTIKTPTTITLNNNDNESEIINDTEDLNDIDNTKTNKLDQNVINKEQNDEDCNR